MNEHTLLQRLELLLACLSGAPAEDELSPQLPVLGDLVGILDLLVDDGVVVLEVGTEALGLERNPGGILVHGGGVLAPVTEVVSVEREGLAQVLDGLGVLEEEDLCGCVSEDATRRTGASRGMTMVGLA